MFCNSEREDDTSVSLKRLEDRVLQQREPHDLQQREVRAKRETRILTALKREARILSVPDVWVKKLQLQNSFN